MNFTKNIKKGNIKMDAMSTLFNTVPNEQDTTILKNDYISINNIPVLLQVWAWDGLTACSAVIPHEFSSNYNEDGLLEILRKEVKIDDSYTLTNDNKFTFINFAFCS